PRGRSAGIRRRASNQVRGEARMGRASRPIHGLLILPSVLTRALFSTIKIAAALGRTRTTGTERRRGRRRALGLSALAVGLAGAAVGAAFLTGLLQIGEG